MKKENLFKIFGAILAIVLMPLVFAAGVIQTDTFYDSSNNPLNNVQSVLYNCAGAYTNPDGEMRCTSVGSLLYNLNSGSSNSISFEYPYNPLSTPTNLNYYAQYLYRDCYMPRDYVNYIWGYDAYLNYNYNFNKATSCHSPIDSFSITNTNYANEPVVVNVQVVAEADAQSAFTDYNNGEVWYPSAFSDYYSAETLVTLQVLDSGGNIAYTDSEIVEIYMDSSENIEFRWTPSVQGDYTARITTEVTDCQCASNFQQYSEKEFLVWNARPQDECYTIINDLEANPGFVTEGNPVTLSFNKLSNYADNSFAKTAIPTYVVYEVMQGSVIVDSASALLSSNSNSNDYEEYEFTWIPSSGGVYSIRVAGVGQSPLCVGKTNPEDIATLGIFVDSETTYNVQVIVRDSAENALNLATVNFGSSTGTTDSSGILNFNVNPGTYSWQVARTGYITSSGTLVVSGNATLTVTLLVDYAPALNIPDQYLLENSGHHEDLVNLQTYTTDADTPLTSIVYSMVSQSNTSVANCSIDAGDYIDCTVQSGTFGFTDVSVSASDGVNSVTDVFRVNVGVSTNGTILNIIYPLGGERLDRNVNITWGASNVDGHALAISLYYSLDNGTTWNTLALNEPNDGIYTWNTRVYPDGDYILRIVALDLVSGVSVSDQTDIPFYVDNPRRSSSSDDDDEDTCESIWQCSGWNVCENGFQLRTCTDINSCDASIGKPTERKTCGGIVLGSAVLELGDAKGRYSLGEKIIFLTFFVGLILCIIIAAFLVRMLRED